MRLKRKSLIALTLIAISSIALVYGLIVWNRQIPTTFRIVTSHEWSFQYCNSYPETAIWVGNSTEIMSWQEVNGTDLHRNSTYILKGYLVYKGDAVDKSLERAMWNYTGALGTGITLVANISCNEDPSTWANWIPNSPWGDANYHLRVKFILTLNATAPDGAYNFVLNVNGNNS